MGANMTSWAFNAATRFVQQERMRSEEWALALQRHQKLVAQAPILWESTREALQSQIQTFNEHVGRQVLVATATGDNKVAVYAKTEPDPRAVTVEFDSERHWITCSAQPAKGPADFEERIQITINDQSKVGIALSNGMDCTPEEAASHVLDGLMGWSVTAEADSNLPSVIPA